jgi:hypothetical protein
MERLNAHVGFLEETFQKLPTFWSCVQAIQTQPLGPPARAPRIFPCVCQRAGSAFSTNERFVRLNGGAHAVAAARVDRVANPVQHEPCRALHYSERLRQLARTDTVLAVRKKPHRSQPLVERNCAVLEDGADLDGELLLAVEALPCQARRKKRQSLRATPRASRPPRPLRFRDQFQTNTRVRKVASGFLQTLWEVWINCFHEVSLRTRKGESSDLLSVLSGRSPLTQCAQLNAQRAPIRQVWASLEWG